MQIMSVLLAALVVIMVYIAAKVVAHLVSEEVEGRINQLGFGLVRLACLRLPVSVRAEYYEWWQADLAEHFQRERDRPITRLFWAGWFAVPLLFTGRKTARILSPEAFATPSVRRSSRRVSLMSNDQNLWIPGGRAFPEDDRRSHRILIKTSVGALAGRHARAH
ncbi:hypothetical protein IU423_30575, partial [Nocardia farcinica]